ncbi:MAG: hypothetical protein IJM18_06225, partial [Clostridia bacterium]|nr:hypothetical protein [Clostridia bacterium]
MASETQKKNTGLIRRFIAILLTAISLTFLFWPGMISSSTEEMKEEIEERAEMYEKYSDYSRADAKALAKAEVRNYNVSLSYSAFRRQLSYLSFRQNLEEKYAKRNWKKSYYGRQYSSYTEYINDNMSQDEKESRAMIKYGAIAANV